MISKNVALMYHQRIFGFILTNLKSRDWYERSPSVRSLVDVLNRVGVSIIDALDLQFFLNVCDAGFNYTVGSEGQHPKKLWYLFINGPRFEDYHEFKKSKLKGPWY